MSISLGVIIPCYNEEEALPETLTELISMLDELIENGLVEATSSLYFVDDGSSDLTWQIIEQHAIKDQRVRGIKLSRNCGHQNALLAGLFAAEGDVLVSIDADLQDDVSVIQEMIRKHLDGNEIVYGVRKSRVSDSRFKRHTAQFYYRLLELLGVEVVYNHADYRLLSRKVLDCLEDYSEVNIFLRSIIPLIGFSTATVEYDRSERRAGKSKYHLGKMLGLAVDGITSFSITPLRIISILGFVICFLSLAMITWIFFGKIFFDTFVPGWASSTIAIYFLGGVQLFSIGVVGEYVAKIYLETKRRPRYFVEKTI